MNNERLGSEVVPWCGCRMSDPLMVPCTVRNTPGRLNIARICDGSTGWQLDSPGRLSRCTMPVRLTNVEMAVRSADH